MNFSKLHLAFLMENVGLTKPSVPQISVTYNVGLYRFAGLHFKPVHELQLALWNRSYAFPDGFASTNIPCQLCFITFPVHSSIGLADLFPEVCFVLYFCEGLGVLLLLLWGVLVLGGFFCYFSQHLLYFWSGNPVLLRLMFPSQRIFIPFFYCFILQQGTYSKSSANHSTCSRAMPTLHIISLSCNILI